MLFIQEGCIKLIKKVTAKECIMLQEFCISIKCAYFCQNELSIHSKSILGKKCILVPTKISNNTVFNIILNKYSFTTYHDYLIFAFVRTV